MTEPCAISFAEQDLDAIAAMAGTVVIFATPDGRLDRLGKRVNRLSKGAAQRVVDSDDFGDLSIGGMLSIGFPSGMAAERVVVFKAEKKPSGKAARKAGAALAKSAGKGAVHVLSGGRPDAAEMSYGFALRRYKFTDHKSDPKDEAAAVTFHVSNAEAVSAAAAPMAAMVEGVFFARDLTNEPANVLTTDDFAARLAAMQELGLEVEIFEEPQLAELGMRALLGVGLGSRSPTKMVVMRWSGGGDEAPLALIGKGVVFDTGGISIKPASGMESMTMDMGGAAVVSGVMRSLALRKARANVVGVVGLVENMPDGAAQRPGDVVRSMKGDTIEIINTDAEGRLVLADVMWYAQETFAPAAMIDFATLTGAILVALGHEKAGAFSNDDDLVENFMKSAAKEGEGVWRMPLSPGYAKLIESRIADVKNSGGRLAGSATAAEFLQRFVKDDMPWMHLDIAGVASQTGATTFAPGGASGWGVRSIDRLIRDQFEQDP